MRSQFLLNQKKKDNLSQIYAGEFQETQELKDMHLTNDWSQFDIPIRMEKIVGEFIDRLHPREIVLLKIASVIGNIFDIDKLHQLNPFNTVTMTDLRNILLNLEKTGILEILFDEKKGQIICKFAIPFMREVLYQRMLIEQRNELHVKIATQIKQSSFSYMSHDKEVALMNKHLLIGEKDVMSHLNDNDENYTQNTSLSDHNLKLVLQKKIQGRLMQIQRDRNPLNNSIIKAYLEKKSDSNITWERRFLVATETKLLYYYAEHEFYENKQPLGFFFINKITKLEGLDDYAIGGKKYIIFISATEFYKKETLKQGRNFYFSCTSHEEMLNWIITLNFLKLKATYDEFVKDYGFTQLPLNLGDKPNKQYKKTFKGIKRTRSYTNNFVDLYAQLARRSMFSDNKKSMDSLKASIIKKGSLGVLPRKREGMESENYENEKIINLKQTAEKTMKYSIVCVLDYIQKVIFGYYQLDFKGNSMSVPKYLKVFIDQDELMQEVKEL